MVATRPPRGVERGGQEIEHRAAVGPGQTKGYFTRRVYPVADLTRPGPGDRDHRQGGDAAGDCLHHQVCERRQTPVLEPQHQVSGHPDMLERGHNPNPALEDALRGRTQVPAASLAEKATCNEMTPLTDHRRRPYFDTTTGISDERAGRPMSLGPTGHTRSRPGCAQMGCRRRC